MDAREAERRLRLMANAGITAREFAAGMDKIAAAVAGMGEAFGRAVGVITARWELVLEVEDPATWKPSTVRGALEQMRAVFLHELYSAAGRPERSPGARWVRRRRP